MKHNDSDIENLNSQIEYTKEEKMKVQKTFFFLLVGSVIVMILCLVFLFYSEDIKSFFDKTNTEEEIIEEKEDEGLYSLNDGSININNEYIQELYDRLFLAYNEHYLFSSPQLYTKEISNFSDKDKLFLVSKTQRFNKLVDKNGDIYSKEDLCNRNTYIEEEKVEAIAKENFNFNNLNHTSFYMIFEKDNVALSFMEFTYDNDNYIGKCIEYETPSLDMVATSILSTATKEKDYIYLDIKVIFQNENGVYKDSNLTTKISDVFNEEYELNYYASGSLYRIYYKYNDNKDYFLEKIELMQ